MIYPKFPFSQAEQPSQVLLCSILLCTIFTQLSLHGEDLQRLRYRHPRLSVDLGVGLWAWPLPMDYDRDGDLDLVVSCPDKPYNGTYFFENADGSTFPVFRKPVRIGKGLQDLQVSYDGEQPLVVQRGLWFRDFRGQQFGNPQRLGLASNFHRPVGKVSKNIRSRLWSLVDYDGDQVRDLVIGIGDWTEYGWDDAYNQDGEWTHGPLHGFVYVAANRGSNAAPKYDLPRKVQAGSEAVDVYGRPCPNFADFDRDGDLDLLCGEFLDGFTYFQNVGTRTEPKYAAGKRLPVSMDLEMIAPVAIDWDRDQDVDLIVGDEDGRVAWLENTGDLVDQVPQFRPPRYFQQEADLVKCGALSTPVGVDWDEDGDQDILCGNTAGYIEYFENLSGAKTDQIQWARPVKLAAGGKTIRIQAGPNGSIQGPCEAKWGYTTLSVADWDDDGKQDILANSIWGKVIWFRQTNQGLEAARPVHVQWEDSAPKPAWNWWSPDAAALVTQWRTTPFAVDFDGDRLIDLVMLDHEGYLCLYRRARVGGELVLLPPKRHFVQADGRPLRLNSGRAGRSGRRKLVVTDWDGDGRLDVIVNSINADWYRNVETKAGKTVLRHEGKLADRPISSHTTSPTTVDWNGDSIPDLLIGAEDGHLYYQRNPRSRPAPTVDPSSKKR